MDVVPPTVVPGLGGRGSGQGENCRDAKGDVRTKAKVRVSRKDSQAVLPKHLIAHPFECGGPK